MLQLKPQNLHQISAEHGLSREEISSQSSHLTDYLDKIHSRKQGFYSVIDDQQLISDILAYDKTIKGKYQDIVVLGIGGSALGTICLQQSLKHLYENELDDEETPSLHVIDNIDPEFITAIDDIIDYETTLFIVVTKSGGTPETLAQYFYFRDKVSEADLKIQDHFVFITDPKKGLLRQIASEEKIPSFEVPPNVGGRFSVLTAVGLLPSAIINIDIEQLVAGAKQMRDCFLSTNADSNPCFQLATIQYLLNQKGKTINVMIPYSQRLIKFADWFRQLLAESIGKETNEKGERVNVGLTPVNALGVTDQHSQSQLYMDGPNDKLLIFIKVEKQGEDLKIPNPSSILPLDKGGWGDLAFLKNLSFNKLIHTEMEGTIQALTQQGRPSLTITIPEVNEFYLGQLFMLFEGATSLLGEFYNINAFDQPGVELSKNLTKKLLA